MSANFTPRQDAVNPRTVEIVEVSARDGLQNEKVFLTTGQKIELVERMAAAGARRIEVTSFARPDKVPQMADAEAVIAGLDLPEDVVTIGLVMNKKGLFRALETSIREIGALTVASDAFARANQGQSREESLRIAGEIVTIAKAEGRRAQVTIGAAFGCPFEGEVPIERVVEMAQALASYAPIEISLADTIGVAVPAQVFETITRVRAVIGSIPVRVHLHNTRNTGIANAWAAVEAGASTFDSSVGGIGGCPFAPKATGNIATEDLLYLLDRSGIASGVSLAATIETAQWLAGLFDRELPGLVSRSGNFPG